MLCKRAHAVFETVGSSAYLRVEEVGSESSGSKERINNKGSLNWKQAITHTSTFSIANASAVAGIFSSRKTSDTLLLKLWFSSPEDQKVSKVPLSKYNKESLGAWLRLLMMISVASFWVGLTKLKEVVKVERVIDGVPMLCIDKRLK